MTEAAAPPQPSQAPGFAFRLRSIPVRIHFSFVIVMLVFAYGRSPAGMAQWFGVATVAVLFHELGHAFAIRAAGRQPAIQLAGFGGLTDYAARPPLSPARQLGISLAGPAAGALLGGLALLVFDVADLHNASLRRDILWVTFGWSVLNLIPAAPLDGGNAVNHFLALITGRRWPRVSAAIGIAVWGGALVWALRTQQWTFAALLGLLLMSQWSALMRAAPTPPPAGDVQG